MDALNVDAVYAGSLFEVADDLDRADDFRVAMRDICAIMREHSEFRTLLSLPTLTADDKKAAAAAAFRDHIPGEMLHFLYILIDKRRIWRLLEIGLAYEKLCNARLGVTDGRIVSAAPLTDVQLEKFEKETSRLLRYRVCLESEVNPELIGGVRIFVAGKLIDASIRTKLDELKENLL